MDRGTDTGIEENAVEDTSQPHPHIVRSFDEQIGNLRSLMLEMGGTVEAQVQDAVDALHNEDVDQARLVIVRDQVVNSQDVQLDEEIVNFIALRQPMGGDLRTVVSIAKAVTDLERIGDEAEKIARMTVQMYGEDSQPPKKRLLRHIRPMAKRASELLRNSLNSFARLDVEEAVLVSQGDEELDHDLQSALRELMTYIMEEPRIIGHAMKVVWVVKALERIGDHAKNISEYTIYLVKGKDVRHTSPDVMHDVLDAHD